MRFSKAIASTLSLCLIHTACTVHGYYYWFGSYLYVIQNLDNPNIYLTVNQNNQLAGQTRSVDDLATGPNGGPGNSDRQIWYYPPGNQIQNQAISQYLGTSHGSNSVILSASKTSGWILNPDDTLQWQGNDNNGYLMTLNSVDLLVYLQPPAYPRMKYQKWRKIPFPDPFLLKRAFYIVPANNTDLAIQANLGPNNYGLTYVRTTLGKRSQDRNRGIFQMWIIGNQPSTAGIPISMAAAPNVGLDVSQCYADGLYNGQRALLGYTYHNFLGSALWEVWEEEPFKSKTTGKLNTIDGWNVLVPDTSNGQISPIVYAQKLKYGGNTDWSILSVSVEENIDPSERIGPYFIDSVSRPGFSLTVNAIGSKACSVCLMQSSQLQPNPNLLNVTDLSLFQQWWYYPALQEFKPLVWMTGALEVNSTGGSGFYVGKEHGGWTQRFTYDPDARVSTGGGIYNPSFSRYLQANDGIASASGVGVTTNDIVPGQQVPSSCSWILRQAPIVVASTISTQIASTSHTLTTTEVSTPTPTTPITFQPPIPKTIKSCSYSG